LKKQEINLQIFLFSETEEIVGTSGTAKPVGSQMSGVGAVLPATHPSVALFQENGFEQKVSNLPITMAK
jgi:hypothetical protein